MKKKTKKQKDNLHLTPEEEKVFDNMHAMFNFPEIVVLVDHPKHTILKDMSSNKLYSVEHSSFDGTAYVKLLMPKKKQA
jgi:hypothetical protein